MAFVVKTAKTLRTHWKKSIFGFCVSVYGINFLKKKHEENLLRRSYCEEARLTYGNKKILLGQRPRKVTVFLNPAANGGKARKLFEKTAAPILYLSGMEINVISTEYEGQVKQFMSVLDTNDTDAVVVAGGDGTLLEAVTGFLRKENKDFNENIPIGVIPVGKTNRFAQLWFGYDLDQVKMIAEAAIAVVHSVTKKMDVIKFDGGEGKAIYSLCGMEAGAYREAEERKSKYWYFGPLKSRWTYLRSAMKEWPPVLKAAVSYVEATEDNMGKDEDEDKEKKPAASWSFFDFLFRRKQKSVQLDEEARAKKEELLQEEMKKAVQTDVETVELTVTTTNLAKSRSPLNALQVGFGPENPTKSEVISEGWSRIKRPGFFMGAEDDEKLVVKKVRIEPSETVEWFNIDGESFEAIPMDVSLLRNKLNFFCAQSSSR